MAYGRSGNIFGHAYDCVSGHTAAGSVQLHDVLVNESYYPASGSFIDVSGCERVHCLILLGELADAITFTIHEAEAADGTADTLSTDYYRHTCAANDDNEFACITVNVSDLTADHHWLTCQVESVSGSNYAAIIWLLERLDTSATSTTLPAASIHYNNA